MANLSETAQFTKDAVERALTRWLFLCQGCTLCTTLRG
jgi:hypothetical protein